ncbi:hypothetical protein D9615_003124 [Tricholomella constricta]|uniref:Uncharacterized protein n=1 Tax=Tricholomella constricta TaxID=117010 RepID=A0A8H5HIX8_9AGAR|nr:hypothetical protein D9615_003124 [Tricholomella constricta]
MSGIGIGRALEGEVTTGSYKYVHRCLGRSVGVGIAIIWGAVGHVLVRGIGWSRDHQTGVPLTAGIPGPIPEDFDFDAYITPPDVLMVPEIPLQTRIERNVQIEKYDNQSIFKTITVKETPCPRPEDLDIGPPLKHGYAFTDDEFKELIESEAPYSTRQSYGAGLLRFTQFCDRLRILEEQRMPASDLLLSIFVADASGSHSGNCVRNWLNGLCSWHMLNRAEWHGQDPWVLTYKKAADKLGVPFKRPPRSPITGKHLLALHQKLDLHSPRDAAIWAAALTAFWGCRHLGELLPTSTSFSPAIHISRTSDIKTSVVNGAKVITFHLPSTKASPSGDQCILTATSNVFCPISALLHHLRLNNISSLAHLFAYYNSNSSSPTVLTKSLFLNITPHIFSSESLDPVFGHSYRIGGTVELLATGVPPEVVMKLGSWTSLCFLHYW